MLSNNDGCVVAANRQAKEAGIQKFKPFFEVEALCKQRQVISVSSNYELYADLSLSMMQTIARFAPEQYIYSIDECFLSFKRCFPAINDLHSHCLNLRKTVWKENRLAVCVGVGPTLTLAKVSNHTAKKNPKYNGVFVIDTEDKRREALECLAVEDVWGIGRKTSSRLHFIGVNTALDLANYPVGLARKEFNIEIERVVRELNGQICRKWDNVRADKRQIFSTRSVGDRIEDIESLSQSLSLHAAIASRKARKQGSLCKVMICFANSSPFDVKPVSRKAVHRFAYPTADTTQITSAAVQIAHELFQEKLRFYKIGVGLIDLVDGRCEQSDLFNPTPNNHKLMKVFDGLNNRYGSDTIFLAAQGINQKWAMRRDKLTPQYTTRWKDIPKIKC